MGSRLMEPALFCQMMAFVSGRTLAGSMAFPLKESKMV
jgi:hypothetical protein